MVLKSLNCFVLVDCFPNFDTVCFTTQTLSSSVFGFFFSKMLGQTKIRYHFMHPIPIIADIK